MLFDRPLAIVDLETTGGHITRDRITEVGVILIDGEQVERFDMLVNPGQGIPPFIEEMTGISDAMVADAPPFAAIADGLLEKLQGRLFIAHNVRFDYGFLKNEFKRVGIKFRSEVLCTVKLSRKLYPQHYKHNLDSIIQRHAIQLADRHRAMADAEALYQFLQQSLATLGRDTVETVAAELMAQPAVPPGLDPEVMDNLPDVPGVYVFYGENELPLYVGKSSNLRNRVLAHFAGEHRQHKELQLGPQVRRVEWHETLGDFGAQLLELQLIKELKPIHNPRGRLEQELCSIQLQQGGSGFLLPRIVQAREVDFSRLDSLYGLFRSQKEAKKVLTELCTANGLCQTCLQLEKRGARKGACQAHLQGRCKGACVGKEEPGDHNIRLLHALSRLQLKSWPYAGAVAVRETDPVSGEWEEYLFERWCYLGLRRSGDRQPAGKPRFDHDIYKLLAAFLRKPGDNATVIEQP
ncbi:exonuclease domain-containing protein [Vogesella sp. LIG4]|uniref:exonuclease domain-containing protein n=1 Tax=Vogesella sp. LIG4 TaxID=1192162 RepID=UPI00081FC5D2|nr:exonuclease domain-containing protein [Vogesella sp. LIG4]SCK06221.1 DNA polymerase-3 subunit epsilon [Vogesella sp. LIG4]